MIAEFILPMYVTLPRKTKKDKRISLNLNVYRNLHPQVNNQIKQLFQPIQTPGYFRASKARISYIVFPRDKRIFDTRNITDVVDKFFLDWLIKNGYLPDDNYLHVSHGGDDVDLSGEYKAVVKAVVEYETAGDTTEKEMFDGRTKTAA